MKLKELQSLMQDIEPFEDPNVTLEQYATGVEVAARVLFTIDSIYGDFEGCTVVDLGCGTGRLSIGAALLGSPHVIGVDVDAAALSTCQANLRSFEGLQVDLLQLDVSRWPERPRLSADTVVMNPPFGTRNKGADLTFLKAGLKIARCAVYSLHKSSTREHVRRVATKELGCGGGAEVLAQLRYDLPASYSFHRQRTRDIEVDLWRFKTGAAG